MDKTITKTIYRVNREWYKVQERTVVGDMYWHFQVADDFRTTDLGNLVKTLLNDIDMEASTRSSYDVDDEESFPIYSVETTQASIEIFDDMPPQYKEYFEQSDDALQHYDVDQWSLATDKEGNKLMFAACTPGYGKQAGLDSDIRCVLRQLLTTTMIHKAIGKTNK